MRYCAPHRSCGECWADADRDGNHPRCCQRNVPALRVGKSVPGLFQNARIHLSAVRKGRSASRVVSLARRAAAGHGLQKSGMATSRSCRFRAGVSQQWARQFPEPDSVADSRAHGHSLSAQNLARTAPHPCSPIHKLWSRNRLIEKLRRFAIDDAADVSEEHIPFGRAPRSAGSLLPEGCRQRVVGSRKARTRRSGVGDTFP